MPPLVSVPETFVTRVKDLMGRLGELRTASGVATTPCLLPVISVSGGPLSGSDIRGLGFEFAITNAYLWMKSGNQKDIHEATGFKGVMMTDSGGYQVLVYGSVGTTNREVIEYQKKIHSDVAVILDRPTGLTSYKEAKLTVEQTIRSEEEAKSLIADGRTLWVAPIQGGVYQDLMASMLKKAVELDYDIYALGSPTPLMERHRYAELLDMIYFARMRIPYEKPLHLFGAGHPSMFSLAVAAGADSFDSAAYALFAKQDRYMTSFGSEKLDNIKELPCSCPVCSRYTVRELMQLPKKERERQLALHNLYVSMAEIKEIRNAIREGRLWDLVESRARGSPELWQAFLRFKEYGEGFMEHADFRKTFGRGMNLIDALSTDRPELKWHLEKVKELTSAAQVVELVPRWYKGKRASKAFLAGYPFVLAPYELVDVYPVSYMKYARMTPEEELAFLEQRLPTLLQGKKVITPDPLLAGMLGRMGIDCELRQDQT